MSRALEIFVCGIIAFAQLAVALFLLERHAQSATSVRLHAVQNLSEGMGKGRTSNTPESAIPAASPSAPSENVFRAGTKIFHLAATSQILLDFDISAPRPSNPYSVARGNLGKFSATQQVICSRVLIFDAQENWTLSFPIQS